MKTVLQNKYENNIFANLNHKDTLLIAIGNSSRSDDGLAWTFLERLKKREIFKGEMSDCYQLQIEDGELISHYPRVIFVDACEGDLPDGFAWEKTNAQNDFTFTTHALTPKAVLFLCNELYQKFPEAYTLKIKGYHWELRTGLSKRAEGSLEKALKFFEERIAL